MTISCTKFLNELDLLELRLKELEGVVDLHVLCEANATNNGLSKPLHFEENRKRFDGWPIKHVVVRDMPFGWINPWDREHHQEAAMWAAVKEENPDVVIVTDLDEIPSNQSVRKFQSMSVDMAYLDMDFLIHFMDRVAPKVVWKKPFITRNGREFQRRSDVYPLLIPDGGWHFEFMGDKNLLLEKIEASSHGTEEPGRDFWNRVYRGERPNIGHAVEPYPVERLPLSVRQNLGLWKSRGYFSDSFNS